MTSPITAKTCEAWFLLEAADLRGLPAPFDVKVTDDGTSLGLRTVDDLNVWADALGGRVTSHLVDGRTHWNVAGELHEMAVSVFAVTSVQAVSA